MIKRLLLAALLICLGVGEMWGDTRIDTYFVNITEHKYATFSVNDQNTLYIQVPVGVTAYKLLGTPPSKDDTQCAFTLNLVEFKLDSDRKIQVTETSGATSMILYSETPATYTIKVGVGVSGGGARVRSAAKPQSLGRYSFGNMLIPTVEGMSCDEIMANMEIADEVIEFHNTIAGGLPVTRSSDGTIDGSLVGTIEGAAYYFYKLAAVTKDDITRVGFFWGAQNGGPFTMTNHKAILAIRKELVNQSAGARVRLIDETGLFAGSDEATAIELIPVADAPQLTIECTDTYDLLGRKVATPLPGHIYIKNGKKYIR